jgi:hypothetical protein
MLKDTIDFIPFILTVAKRESTSDIWRSQRPEVAIDRILEKDDLNDSNQR